MKVCVIGAAAIDITAKSLKEFVPRDSNPSNISLSEGGVARNVAHNLSLLDQEVHFLTSFTDDVYSKALIESCKELGFDISHSKYISGRRTPIYMCITDENGSLMAGAADMELADEIDLAYIKENIDYINSCDCVFFDTNINKDTIEYMLENIKVPIFIDLVSVKRSHKLKEIIGAEHINVHTLKANDLEAASLVGREINDDMDLIYACDYLHEKGFKNVFITLGEKGVFCSDGNEKVKLPSRCINILSDTGAGDSFLAALIFAQDKGLTLKQSAICASEVAKITLESMSSINEELSPRLLEGLFNE